MTTVQFPLSALWITMDFSDLSCISAIYSCLHRFLWLRLLGLFKVDVMVDRITSLSCDGSLCKVLSRETITSLVISLLWVGVKFRPFSRTESCSGVRTMSDKLTTHVSFSVAGCGTECCWIVDRGVREQLSSIVDLLSVESRSYFSRSFCRFLPVSFISAVTQ